MAQFDIASKQQTELFFRTLIDTDNVTATPSVDTKDLCAIYFNSGVAVYTDGDYEFELEESEDDTIWSAIPAEKFINNATSAGLNIAADSAEGDILNQVGVFSTMNFVRAAITSDNTTSGAILYLTLTGELKKAVDQ